MRTGNTVEGQLRQTNVYLLEFTRTASKTFVQQLDHLDRIYSSQRPAIRQCNNKMFDDLLVSQPTGTRFRRLHKRSPPGGCGARGSETGEPVRTPGPSNLPGAAISKGFSFEPILRASSLEHHTANVCEWSEMVPHLVSSPGMVPRKNRP